MKGTLTGIKARQYKVQENDGPDRLLQAYDDIHYLLCREAHFEATCSENVSLKSGNDDMSKRIARLERALARAKEKLRSYRGTWDASNVLEEIERLERGHG